MRSKVLLAVLLTLFFGINSRAQSIYYFKYHYPQAGDTVTYQAFMVRYDDGTGFIRVHYIDDSTNQEELVEMLMQEGYDVNKKGKVDSTKLYFQGYDPIFLRGNAELGYNPDIFWFQYDNSTDYYNPWAIVSPDSATGRVDQGEYLDVKLLNQEDLTPDFVNQFFDKEEGFFQNVTEVATGRGLTNEEKKTKMYLLIAANTLDADIGSTCEEDRKQTEKVFGDLAEFLGIQLVKKSIYGQEYNKKNIETAIQSLNPSPKDIVVFYYTGHGFSQNDNYQFPHIALTAKSFESARANSLNMEEVYARIKSKGARFNLVLSDCCNNSIEGASAIIPVNMARTRASNLPWDPDNCKALFMNPKPTSILMTAASRDELSCGISSGGLFTTALRSSLIDFFSKFRNNVTWAELLTEAKNDTIKRADKTAMQGDNGTYTRCKQHPIFKIQVD